MGYSAKSESIRLRYYTQFLDRVAGKPKNIQLLAERSFSSACMVVEKVEPALIPELIIGTTVFQHAFFSSRFSHLYAGLISQAKSAPEDFVFGLHSFYEDMTSTVRKHGYFRETADFLGSVMRAHVEKRKTVGDTVADSYVNLALQTLEYLRPNKYEFETCVYGVSTDGKPLAGPCPLPYADLPSIEIQHEIAQGMQFASTDEYFQVIQRKYAAHGMDIRTPYDFNKLEQLQQTHINTVAALLPFINEHTWDMAPIIPCAANVTPLAKLSYPPIDLDSLKTELSLSRAALPKERVEIQFKDPDKFLRWLVLTEIQYKSRPYILYRLVVHGGCFYGYYDICDGFLYSILREATSSIPFRNFTALFLTLYASLALPDAGIPEVNSIFKQGGQPLGIRLP